jgi:hypothetical protein
MAHSQVVPDGSMNLRALRLCVLAVGLAVAVAACGGSSGGAAGSTTSTTSSAAGGSRTAAFTACLKQHGVTLPAGGIGPSGPPGQGTPGQGTPGSRPPGGFGGGGPSISIPGVSAKQLQAAMSACRSKLPSGGFGGGAANSQALQAYLSCLKDHGVTVPTSTSGTTPGGQGSALGAVRSQPKFAAANKVCQALLPTFGASTTTTGQG